MSDNKKLWYKYDKDLKAFVPVGKHNKAAIMPKPIAYTESCTYQEKASRLRAKETKEAVEARVVDQNLSVYKRGLPKESRLEDKE